MATIINTPSRTDNSEDSGSGWAVAVIILLVVIGIGAYFWMLNRQPSAPTSGTNINVTLPQNPTTNTTPAL